MDQLPYVLRRVHVCVCGVTWLAGVIRAKAHGDEFFSEVEVSPLTRDGLQSSLARHLNLDEVRRSCARRSSDSLL